MFLGKQTLCLVAGFTDARSHELYCGLLMYPARHVTSRHVNAVNLTFPLLSPAPPPPPPPPPHTHTHNSLVEMTEILHSSAGGGGGGLFFVCASPR